MRPRVALGLIALERLNHQRESLHVSQQPDGDLRLQAVLVPTVGTVEIASTPAGAEVIVNNRISGVTPTTVGDLPPNEDLHIELRLRGYKAASRHLAWSGSSCTTVSIIDTAANALAGTVAVGSGPGEVATDRAAGRGYVGNFNDGTVSVIDTASRTTIATLSSKSSVGPSRCTMLSAATSHASTAISRASAA